MNIHELHQRALEAAKRYFQAGAKLLEVIQQIDACKGFRELGHTSLFSYAVSELKLSESAALNLINVARKAVQIPALKTEIQAGNLSVCKARKIVPVLTLQNQAEWIEKAKTLPTRKLEKEIARVAPQAAVPDRMRYVTESRIALTVALDEKTMGAIKRTQDLESQKQNRPVTLEETFATLSTFYLEKNDPLEKAKRALVQGKITNTNNDVAIPKTGVDRTDVTVTDTRAGHATHAPKVRAQNQNGSGQMGKSLTRRRSIPAATEHAITLRDGARCTATNPNGLRCKGMRWLHVHHIVPVSLGGANTPENLTTLCSAHHGMRHLELEPRLLRAP